MNKLSKINQVIFSLFMMALTLPHQGVAAVNICEKIFTSKNEVPTGSSPQNLTSLKNLLDQRIFDSAEFYKTFQSQPKLTQKLITRWYGSKFFKEWNPQFRALGNVDATVLMLDPGIVDRAGEFVNFSRHYLQGHSSTDVVSLRKAFSSYLGKTKTYRSMILTDSAAAEIRTKGLQSPGQFNKNATPMNWFGDASTMGPIKEFVDRVLRDDETKGLAISASEIPEVALAAASMRLKSEDTNHSIFLLEIITDEINIVRENQRVSTLPAFKRLRDQTFDRALVFSSPDRKWYNASWSFGQAEMFLLNFVPANEIIRASKISDRRPWTIDLVGNPRGTTSLDKTENSRREFQVLEDPDGFYLP